MVRLFRRVFCVRQGLGKGEGAREIAASDEKFDGGLDDGGVLRFFVINPKSSQQRIDSLLRVGSVSIATSRVDVQESHLGAHACKGRLFESKHAFGDRVEQSLVLASVSVVELGFQQSFDIARRQRVQFRPLQEVLRRGQLDQQFRDSSTALSSFDLFGGMNDEASAQVCVGNEPHQVERLFDLVACCQHERHRQDSFCAFVRLLDILQDLPCLLEVSCQGVFDGEPCEGSALLFGFQRSRQVGGERHEGLTCVFHLVLDHPSSRLGEQPALQESIFDAADSFQRVTKGVGSQHVSGNTHEIGVATLAGRQPQGATIGFEQQAVRRARPALLLRIVREAQEIFQTATARGTQQKVVDENVMLVLHQSERACRKVGQRAFQESRSRAHLLFPLQVAGDLLEPSLSSEEFSCQAKALLAGISNLSFGNALQNGECRF